uniref:Tectonic-1-3 domain-containing protein n=1 Tax=Anopheles dirus TaxID=7168 RepID=A0A182NMB0_9DIPT
MRLSQARKLETRKDFLVQINICDINCCCDIDCNAPILRTFDCDQEELQKEEYDHDAGLQSCRVQGGLFCLVEPIYEEGDESYYNPTRLSYATRSRWKEVFPLDTASTSAEEIRFDHYRVDDVVYLYNETSELVQPFALPYSLTGGSCQIDQPVHFLRDCDNLCRRTVDELSDFNRGLLRHQRAARFFRTPNKSTVMEHYCVEEMDCLNSTVSICVRASPSGWNCTQSLNTTDSTTSEGDMIEEEPGSICRELELVFYHNYTNLQGVEITLRCQSQYPDPSEEDELWEELVWQRISVKFIVRTHPSKLNATRAVSGNIGYLIGKPLIVSHLDIPVNGTTTAEEAPPESPPNRMQAYFTNETRLPDASFRLRVPASRKNRCVLTAETYGTIDFGVDTFHRCNYAPGDLANQTAGSARNYTRFCQELQEGLYSQLLHGVHRHAVSPSGGEGYDKLNLYISKYANPLNRTTEWVQVRSTNVILNAQAGSEQATPNSEGNPASYFTCSNMLINVEYRFYYARVRVRDVRHQAIVHDGEIVFGPRVNLRFRLDEEIRVPIFVQVQFFDLTSSATMVVASLYRLTFLAGFGLLFPHLVGA